MKGDMHGLGQGLGGLRTVEDLGIDLWHGDEGVPGWTAERQLWTMGKSS